MDVSLKQMSFGQARKLMLLRAMINDPEILLLDEPFSGLDRYMQNELASAIEKYVCQGKTLIMTTHRTENIPAFIDQFLNFCSNSRA